MNFNTPFGLKLNIEQTVSEIIRFMKDDEKRHYKHPTAIRYRQRNDRPTNDP